MASSKSTARHEQSLSPVRPAASGNDCDTLGLILERALTLTRLLIKTADDNNSAVYMIQTELEAADEAYLALLAANKERARGRSSTTLGTRTSRTRRATRSSRRGGSTISGETEPWISSNSSKLKRTKCCASRRYLLPRWNEL
jgi:hypothetical protein